MVKRPVDVVLVLRLEEIWFSMHLTGVVGTDVKGGADASRWW